MAKTYTDINTGLRKDAKNDFEKALSKLKNARKYRGIKLATTEAWRNYLVSESNKKSFKKNHLTNIFSENLLGTKMKKTKHKKKQAFMSKPFYVGLSILE